MEEYEMIADLKNRFKFFLERLILRVAHYRLPEDLVS